MKKKKKLDLVHMSNARIAEVEKDILSLEGMLNHPDDHIKGKIQDREGMKNEIVQKRKLLQQHAPKKYRGKAGNKPLAEAKELRERIASAMPKREMYYQPEPKNADRHSKHQDFEQTVKQQVAFQSDPKLKRMIHRYKYIMRRIDPSDPSITNIELLRR